ncbi:methyltransferase domain-containing protein [Streptomyces sp. HNM0574]|uniref:methyltransferase domain-containing protein n=1 Tax=Streptomyces sp. HNM0574 TaxID=2714954 RepID=UPI00146A39FB|nr:methyltransferase domain-containing protein [Streptomyces sp. HNM0574]NLU68385.1 methyltransferase domain-containing protein [Streptomyces sp. HNM0574]
MTQSMDQEVDAYSAGVSHYSSPGRRDAVKRKWEEPVSLRIIEKALAFTGKDGRLRVVDVGCGAGDGLRLIDSVVGPDAEIAYHGLDLDDRLLALAKSENEGRGGAHFHPGDMRYDIPDEPTDLYFSCGVPYSHLTGDELEDTLRSVMERIRRNRTRSAIVVDVLGRYSLEWQEKWPSYRWDYRMNFFQDGGEVEPTPMSFWSSHDLLQVIAKAVEGAGVRASSVDFVDRSVMVGRHTTTGEFNPDIRPYRNLVNQLEEGRGGVEVADLYFPRKTGLAPTPVMAFHQDFRRTWNSTVDDICGGAVTVPERAAATLAGKLRTVEWRNAPGLGVGHSLSAIVGIDGAH